MFGINAVVKAVVALIIVLVTAAGLWYVTGLRADLAVSRENSKKLADAVTVQQEVIKQIQADQQKIRDINNELNTTIRLQNKDVENLKDRFNTTASGEKRDFGKVAAAKPQSLERAVNRGTINALRCVEIASGAPLTEVEKNATKSSEINKECPGLANPNYSPVAQ